MSEIGEVHRKIDEVSKDVSYMRGKLDEKLPTLATEDHVKAAILEHQAQCPLSKKKKSAIYKKPAGISAAVLALAGAIYAFIELFKG